MTKKVGALLDEYPGPAAHDATGAPASASRTIALTSSEKSLRSIHSRKPRSLVARSARDVPACAPNAIAALKPEPVLSEYRAAANLESPHVRL